MIKKIDLVQKSSEFFKDRVSDVISRKKFTTTEVAEFYVVDLLDRYIVTANLFDKEDAQHHLQTEPLAIQLLNAQAPGVSGTEKIRLLKKLGDSSLYISGFFTNSLSRKVVDLEYYRDMGALAYRNLADSIREESFHDLYHELYSKFSDFVEVLSEVSHEFLGQNDQSLLQVYETYLKTGSEAAKKHLMDKGLPAPPLALGIKDKINKS